MLPLLLSVAVALPHGIVMDADSDCCYVPARVRADSLARVPALVVLSCVGAGPVDLDTVRFVADSLNWVLASCHASRNHRDTRLNDEDIVRTIAKLVSADRVDPERVFLFGFSGQGVQALATMFLHPGLVRGTVTACAHDGSLPLADFTRLRENCAWLVTREADWNRDANRRLHMRFNLNGLRSRLVVTTGGHGPGPWTEMLQGCRWLDAVTRGPD